MCHRFKNHFFVTTVGIGTFTGVAVVVRKKLQHAREASIRRTVWVGELHLQICHGFYESQTWIPAIWSVSPGSLNSMSIRLFNLCPNKKRVNDRPT
jgi:hypothetical protein